MEAELTALDTAVEAEWLHELLMDLPMVEKLIPAILMNYDNETVIIKVNSSKDNMKSSRHIKRRIKSVRKLRSSGVIALNYIPMTKFGRSIHKGSFMICDRQCIQGIGPGTHLVSQVMVATCPM
jgi:hypothetical protein